MTYQGQCLVVRHLQIPSTQNHFNSSLTPWNLERESRVGGCMIALEQRVCPRPEVVDTELDDGEMVLLHLESKTYYTLNLTGLRIWQGLKAGLTLQTISHRRQEEFAV